jgi:hypothetical protein
VLVFDTSAFLNGRNDHYPPGTFPSVWQLVGDALTDGRIHLPRAVWIEIRAKDDHINAWIKDHAYVDPPRRFSVPSARFISSSPPGAAVETAQTPL